MMDATRRSDVWVALADQFLDTDTRHEIPAAALACVNAGLSPADARRVWRYEVTPAVYWNAWSVAGEWGAWNREWLVMCIEGERGRWMNRPSPCGWALYWLRVFPCALDRCSVAIERCIVVLSHVSPNRRQRVADGLRWLAAVHFGAEESLPPSADSAELAALYERSFPWIFDPLGSAAAARARVDAALAVLRATEVGVPYRSRAP